MSSTLHTVAVVLLIGLGFRDPRQQCQHWCGLQWVGSMLPALVSSALLQGGEQPPCKGGELPANATLSSPLQAV